MHSVLKGFLTVKKGSVKNISQVFTQAEVSAEEQEKYCLLLIFANGAEISTVQLIN